MVKRDLKYPPKNQNAKKDDCPICGIPLRDDANYQAREAVSRFDNTTMVCCHCGNAEAVGHIITGTITEGMMRFLRYNIEINRNISNPNSLTEWEWHVMLTLLRRGSMLGYARQGDLLKKKMIKKMEEE